MTPRLLFSSLTGQVYVVTRYRERHTPDGRPFLTASVKYDVTSEFHDVETQRRQWARTLRRKGAKGNGE